MSSRRRRVRIAAAMLVPVAAVGLAGMLRPPLEVEAYAAPLVEVRAAEDEIAEGNFSVTFLGVTTLLFDDGETAFMTDGFFSRPGLLRVLTRRLAPDEAAIAQALDRAGVSRLAAVIPLHSHYDHAFDAPVVARRTGAMLLGSESTANIGRGYGLPEERIRAVDYGDRATLGRFRLTFIESRHAPGDRLPGEITAPVRPPARVFAYRTGTVYSLLVEHGERRVLVHHSAGFVRGSLADQQADVVFLSLGDLGGQSRAYHHAYWSEVVDAVAARRVVVVHWDYLFRQLDRPLAPMPWILQDLERSLRFLRRRSAEEGVDLRSPVAFARVDPFTGLAPPPDE